MNKLIDKIEEIFFCLENNSLTKDGALIGIRNRIDEFKKQPSTAPVDGGMKELLNWVKTEFKWFVEHSPGHGVILQIITKIESLIESPIPVQQQPVDFILRKFDSNKYYWCKCENCGWEDSSEFCEGCHPIADSGDCTDPICPICGSNKIEGEPTIDVPDNYSGIIDIKIPIETFLSPYKKELKRLQKIEDDKHWDIEGKKLDQYLSTPTPQQPVLGAEEILEKYLGKDWEKLMAVTGIQFLKAMHEFRNQPLPVEQVQQVEIEYEAKKWFKEKHGTCMKGLDEDDFMDFVDKFRNQPAQPTEVKNLSSNTMLSDSLVAYQKWCYEHPEYDQVTETAKVEIYLKDFINGATWQANQPVQPIPIEEDILGLAICYLKAFIDLNKSRIAADETSKDAEKVIEWYNSLRTKKSTAQPIVGSVLEVPEDKIQALYDTFANWYMDDGSYDTFLQSEAYKAIVEFSKTLKPLYAGYGKEEIAGYTREQVEQLIKVKRADYDNEVFQSKFKIMVDKNNLKSYWEGRRDACDDFLSTLPTPSNVSPVSSNGEDVKERLQTMLRKSLFNGG